VGRCKFERFAGPTGEVINGGNEGWLGFGEGEETGGEVAGEAPVSSVGDMTAAMMQSRLLLSWVHARGLESKSEDAKNGGSLPASFKE
jgi:hypothetical protein